MANKNNINIIYPRLDAQQNVILENEDINVESKNPNEIFLNPGSTVKITNRSNDLNLGFVELVGAVDQAGKYRCFKVIPYLSY